jgi:hypothetical protein
MSDSNFRWLLVVGVWVGGLSIGWEPGIEAKFYLFGFMAGACAGFFLGLVVEMEKHLDDDEE